MNKCCWLAGEGGSCFTCQLLFAIGSLPSAQSAASCCSDGTCICDLWLACLFGGGGRGRKTGSLAFLVCPSLWEAPCLIGHCCRNQELHSLSAFCVKGWKLQKSRYVKSKASLPELLTVLLIHLLQLLHVRLLLPRLDNLCVFPHFIIFKAAAWRGGIACSFLYQMAFLLCSVTVKALGGGDHHKVHFRRKAVLFLEKYIIRNRYRENADLYRMQYLYEINKEHQQKHLKNFQRQMDTYQQSYSSFPPHHRVAFSVSICLTGCWNFRDFQCWYSSFWRLLLCLCTEETWQRTGASRSVEWNSFGPGNDFQFSPTHHIVTDQWVEKKA